MRSSVIDANVLKIQGRVQEVLGPFPEGGRVPIVLKMERSSCWCLVFINKFFKIILFKGTVFVSFKQVFRKFSCEGLILIPLIDSIGQMKELANLIQYMKNIALKPFHVLLYGIILDVFVVTSKYSSLGLESCYYKFVKTCKKMVAANFKNLYFK